MFVFLVRSLDSEVRVGFLILFVWRLFGFVGVRGCHLAWRLQTMLPSHFIRWVFLLILLFYYVFFSILFVLCLLLHNFNRTIQQFFKRLLGKYEAVILTLFVLSRQLWFILSNIISELRSLYSTWAALVPLNWFCKMRALQKHTQIWILSLWPLSRLSIFRNLIHFVWNNMVFLVQHVILAICQRRLNFGLTVIGALKIRLTCSPWWLFAQRFYYLLFTCYIGDLFWGIDFRVWFLFLCLGGLLFEGKHIKSKLVWVWLHIVFL